MKKTPLLFALLCCTAVQRYAAQPTDRIRCGFTGGIPSDFTLIDADGNTPSSDLTKYDFKVGTPWITHYIEKEDNFVAASTSWYEKSGTASDRMIQPPIHVVSAEDLVSWRAMATDKNFRDGYAVYVTEGDGQTVADFDTSRPLCSVEAEQNEWTRHSVSLAPYVGKTVRIAFVNNSTDCSVLYLDDIFAGHPAAVHVNLDMNPVVRPSDKVKVRGQVVTDLDTPVRGFTVGYQYDGRQHSLSYPETEVSPGKPFDFEFDGEDYPSSG